MKYGGRTFNDGEMKYPPSKGELYAIALAAKANRRACIGRDVIIHTDCHAWKDLNVKLSSRAVARWLVDILEIAPRSVYIQGVKNTVADTISRLASNAFERVAVGEVSESRLFVPEELRQEVIREIHEGAHGGHYGVSATTRIVSKKYYWKGMTSDIKNYKCEYCNYHKEDSGRYADKRGKLKVVNADTLFKCLGIDIEELRLQDGTIIYYLFVADYFSKFVEAVKMKNKTAGEVIGALKRSIAWDFSVPQVIIGDQDPAFVSDVFLNFVKTNNIKFRSSSAYHHQGNGLAERMIKTFKPILDANIFQEKLKPKEALKAATGAMNKYLISSTTGMTPNSVVTGIEFNSALDNLIRNLEKNRQKLRQKVKNSTQVQQEKMAKYYDVGKKERSFEIGDKVLIRNEDKKKHGDPKFLGPYLVIRKLEAGKYVLYNKKTNRTYIRNIEVLREKVEPSVDKVVENNPNVLRDVDFSLASSKVAVDRELLEKALKVIGKRISVWWKGDEKYFHGQVVGLSDPIHGGTHDVKYDPDEYSDNEEPISENLLGYGTNQEQVQWVPER
jgi:hypothetical protein